MSKKIKEQNPRHEGGHRGAMNGCVRARYNTHKKQCSAYLHSFIDVKQMEQELVPERQSLGGVFSFLSNKKQHHVIIMARAADVLSPFQPPTLSLLTPAVSVRQLNPVLLISL